jgi:hypothetical protein
MDMPMYRLPTSAFTFIHVQRMLRLMSRLGHSIGCFWNGGDFVCILSWCVGAGALVEELGVALVCWNDAVYQEDMSVWAATRGLAATTDTVETTGEVECRFAGRIWCLGGVLLLQATVGPQAQCTS